MKAAVNAAINQKSISISSGMDADSANAAALETYTKVMNL
jgi:hypothetical protein